VTDETQHRPFLIRKRILESNSGLWGVVAESNNKLHRIGIRDMLGMYLDGTPFLVDYPGEDKPSVLQIVHRVSGNSLIFYFRAIGDDNKKNNLSKVPAIAYGSSKRIKVLKK
jgi:hypothetical protein